ncbi:MAG: hypothetical protein ACJAYU_002334 [Bradymonadia bacterium]|jgi:hypothetical protein
MAPMRAPEQSATILDALLVPFRGVGFKWFASLMGSALILTLMFPIAAYTPFLIGLILLAFLWMIWLHGLLRFASSCLSGTANGSDEPDFGPRWGEIGRDWAVSGVSLMVYWTITLWVLGDFMVSGNKLLGLIVLLVWWPFGFSIATIRGNGWSFWDLPAAFGLLTRKPTQVLLAGFIGGFATILGCLAHAGLSQLPGTGEFIAIFAATGPIIYGMATTGALLGRVIQEDPSVVGTV